jgi:hypothetical protein
MQLTKNVGGLDRALRLCGAAVLIYLGFIDQTIFAPSTAKTLVGLFSIMPMLTGALAYCPLYTVVGISTCPTRRPAE